MSGSSARRIGDLDEMVAEKQFREDLFFRIKGVTLNLPPLRERARISRC